MFGDTNEIAAAAPETSTIHTDYLPPININPFVFPDVEFNVTYAMITVSWDVHRDAIGVEVDRDRLPTAIGLLQNGIEVFLFFFSLF